MDQFSSYDTAWSTVISSLNHKIKLVDAALGERKKISIREAEKVLEEAQGILNQLDLETRNNPSQRQKLQAKSRTFEQELDVARKNLRKAAEGNKRDSLIKTSGTGYTMSTSNDWGSVEGEQRNKILESTALLDRANMSLANAQKLSAENEEIGTDVLTMMDQQKESLLRARDGLDSIDDNMKDARSIVINMTRRVATNKMILAIIILLLLGVIGLILFLRWR